MPDAYILHEGTGGPPFWAKIKERTSCLRALSYFFFAVCSLLLELCSLLLVIRYLFFALRDLFPDSQHLLAQSQLRIVADHYHGSLLRFALQQFAQEILAPFVQVRIGFVQEQEVGVAG